MYLMRLLRNHKRLLNRNMTLVRSRLIKKILNTRSRTKLFIIRIRYLSLLLKCNKQWVSLTNLQLLYKLKRRLWVRRLCPKIRDRLTTLQTIQPRRNPSFLFQANLIFSLSQIIELLRWLIMMVLHLIHSNCILKTMQWDRLPTGLNTLICTTLSSIWGWAKTKPQIILRAIQTQRTTFRGRLHTLLRRPQK